MCVPPTEYVCSPNARPTKKTEDMNIKHAPGTHTIYIRKMLTVTATIRSTLAYSAIEFAIDATTVRDV